MTTTGFRMTVPSTMIINGNNWITMATESDEPKPPSVDVEKLAALRVAEPRKIDKRVPDYVHVITAWRAWAIGTDEGQWRLKSVGVDSEWTPKEALSAECESDNDHPAPQMKCQCGVWAFKNLDDLVAALGNKYDTIKVLGQVSLWGRVVETENGYRAQYAYPSELWLFDESLEELGLIYDVPVRMVSTQQLVTATHRRLP